MRFQSIFARVGRALFGGHSASEAATLLKEHKLATTGLATVGVGTGAGVIYAGSHGNDPAAQAAFQQKLDGYIQSGYDPQQAAVLAQQEMALGGAGGQPQQVSPAAPAPLSASPFSEQQNLTFEQRAAIGEKINQADDATAQIEAGKLQMVRG